MTGLKISELKSLRVSSKIGINSFALLIGVSPRTVQSIESGSNVGYYNLKKYLQGLEKLNSCKYYLILSS